MIDRQAIGPLGEVAQNDGTAIAIGRIGAVREQKRKRSEGEAQCAEDCRNSHGVPPLQLFNCISSTLRAQGFLNVRECRTEGGPVRLPIWGRQI